MANNKAEEFMNKVLSDETLKAQLADKSSAQAAEVAAELGYNVTAEEIAAAEKGFVSKTARRSLSLTLMTWIRLPAERCGLPRMPRMGMKWAAYYSITIISIVCSIMSGAKVNTLVRLFRRPA